MQGKKTKQFKFKLYFFVEKLSFRKKKSFCRSVLGCIRHERKCVTTIVGVATIGTVTKQSLVFDSLCRLCVTATTLRGLWHETFWQNEIEKRKEYKRRRIFFKLFDDCHKKREKKPEKDIKLNVIITLKFLHAAKENMARRRVAKRNFTEINGSDVSVEVISARFDVNQGFPFFFFLQRTNVNVGLMQFESLNTQRCPYNSVQTLRNSQSSFGKWLTLLRWKVVVLNISYRGR